MASTDTFNHIAAGSAARSAARVRSAQSGVRDRGVHGPDDPPPEGEAYGRSGSEMLRLTPPLPSHGVSPQRLSRIVEAPREEVGQSGHAGARAWGGRRAHQ